MKNLYKTTHMKLKSLLILVCFGGLIAWGASCKHEPDGLVNNPPGNNPPPTGGEQPCSADTVYFQNQILPLLISSCAKSNCHDAATRQDGIELTSYATIMATGDVRPGNPNGSDLYEVLNETDPSKIMPRPPSTPLTAAEKQLIFRWIQQGAKNNACNDCDSSQFTFSATIQPLVNSNCRGCHNPNFQSAGLDLSTYNNIRSIALNGKFMGTITHAAGFPAMPRGAAKLSDCRIAQVRKWIEAGAPNN
ncbi:MAG TPA: hypothetical protein DCQ34_01015 [Chitinophagaceae bacterium]|nr:hypothetical protein [Chitinophagaceae bacterium]